MGLAAYLISICLIFLTVLKDRRIGIFYFLPILPLIFLLVEMKEYPMGKDIPDIMLIAIILGWFLQNREVIKTDINRPLYIFVLITFLALLNGYVYLGDLNTGVSRMQEWKNYMIMPLLFFIVVNNVKNSSEIKKLVFYLSIVYLIIGVKFFLDFENPEHFNWSLKSQHVGVFVFFASNHMGAFMVEFMVIFLCLFYYLKENKKYRLYYIAIALIGIYNVVFLFSRGAYVALVALMLILGILKDRKILIALVALFLFWGTILPRSVVERINPTIYAETKLDFGRGIHWDHAYTIFRQNPIFGTGYRTYIYTISDDQKSILKEKTGKAITDTHSLYLNVLAEMGILGFILLLYLFLLALRSGWRLFRLASDDFLKGLGLGFFLCVVATMIVNLFGDRWSNYHVQGYYWIFWALIERGLIVTKEETKMSNPTPDISNQGQGQTYYAKQFN